MLPRFDKSATASGKPVGGLPPLSVRQGKQALYVLFVLLNLGWYARHLLAPAEMVAEQHIHIPHPHTFTHNCEVEFKFTFQYTFELVLLYKYAPLAVYHFTPLHLRNSGSPAACCAGETLATPHLTRCYTYA